MGTRFASIRPRLASRLPLLACVALAMLIGLSATGRGSAAATEFPAELADTGLYADIAAGRIADEVLAFEPQYPLWTDGATKRRWIRIPAGSWIDAGDPDHLVFPVGTRLWKEFCFAQRVETRFLRLDADRHWHFATYIWRADQSGADLAPTEGLPGAAWAAPGVAFDIPSRADCLACHAAGSESVLGFSALQLSPDRDPLAPHAQSLPAGAVDLGELVRRGLVRNLPECFLEHAPRIEAATPRERAALGYLHANCGYCHSSQGALAGLDLNLSYSLARPGPAAAIATTADRASRFRWPSDSDPRRISRQSPALSVLARRMASRQPLSQMPPLGTRLRDSDALELVRDWIAQDLGPSRCVGTTPTNPVHTIKN